MDGMEVVRTTGAVYVGQVTEENACSFDEHDNDVPSIILEPINDKGVEIWIPVEIIHSRRVLIDVI